VFIRNIPIRFWGGGGWGGGGGVYIVKGRCVFL